MSLIPRGQPAPDQQPDVSSLVQGLQEEERRQGWEADAARWRAGALAEAIFGRGVIPRLRYARTALGFRALVELEVPFRDLDDHQSREHRFLAEVGRDELLARIPALFVFTPADPGALVPAPSS